MVQVYADDVLVYDTFMDSHALLELECEVSVLKAGTAKIVMPAGHPAYSSFISYRTVVTIYRNGELLFRGRALYPEDKFDRRRAITCEGERCFLRDAVMQPCLYQASPQVIFADIISRYNAQVEPFKQFQIGAVTARDPNNYIRLEREQAEPISDTVDSLVERVGGFITFTTNGSGHRVINWLDTLEGRNKQRIEFGENLLDFTQTGVNTDLATIIYPYGAKDETTGKRVTIETVNKGLLFVSDSEAVARYGSIAVPVYWDDVTLAKNLLTKARKELDVRKCLVTSMELTAADLSDMDRSIDALRVGDNVEVYSLPHGVDDVLLLSSRKYNLLQPGSDSVVLGSSRVTLTGADVASNRQTIEQLRRTEQSIKTDYTVRITDAMNTLRF